MGAECFYRERERERRLEDRVFATQIDKELKLGMSKRL